MSMNENWPRWIFASLSKHFDGKLTDTPLFIEGQHRDKDDTLQDYNELRTNGPFAREQSKDQWHLYIEVNILINSIMNNTDFHRIHTSAGKVANAFDGTIPVYKYGNNPQDDDTLLGCLDLVQDGGERVQISQFGQVEPNIKLLQATVEGHYTIQLEAI